MLVFGGVINGLPPTFRPVFPWVGSTGHSSTPAMCRTFSEMPGRMPGAVSKQERQIFSTAKWMAFWGRTTLQP